MKAVVLQEGNRLALREVAEPELRSHDDVIVKVTTSAICGSDIHIKYGMMPGIHPGTIIGHEFVGTIVELGDDVKRFKPGDRVAAPAAVYCGVCAACKRGEPQHCAAGGVWAGGDIFGPGLEGAQTSYIRVPYADNCLVPIPDNVADEQAVFVGDVWSTGYHAAYEPGIRTGDDVAVFGCGPIGLAAVVSAQLFSPKRVFAVDTMANRLDIAASYGAIPINPADGDPVGALRAATAGEGVDVAIEAIGMQQTFMQCLDVVRRGGSVSVVGLFPQPFEVPMNRLPFQGIHLHMGLSNTSRMSRLMGLLETGRVDLSPFVTHTFPLDQAMEAYDLFENHKDRCLKVVLKP